MFIISYFDNISLPAFRLVLLNTGLDFQRKAYFCAYVYFEALRTLSTREADAKHITAGRRRPPLAYFFRATCMRLCFPFSSVVLFLVYLAINNISLPPAPHP